jgi:hypothetical protein
MGAGWFLPLNDLVRVRVGAEEMICWPDKPAVSSRPGLSLSRTRTLAQSLGSKELKQKRGMRLIRAKAVTGSKKKSRPLCEVLWVCLVLR